MSMVPGALLFWEPLCWVGFAKSPCGIDLIGNLRRFWVIKGLFPLGKTYAGFRKLFLNRLGTICFLSFQENGTWWLPRNWTWLGQPVVFLVPIVINIWCYMLYRQHGPGQQSPLDAD